MNNEEIICMASGEFDALKKDVDKLSDKMDGIQSAVISIDKTLVRLEENHKQTTEILHVVLPRVREIEQGYVHKDQFERLASRVGKIEIAHVTRGEHESLTAKVTSNRDFVIKATAIISCLTFLLSFYVAIGDKLFS